MGSTTRTYLALEFSSLMSKDYVSPKAWKGTGFEYFGDMKAFNENWWLFKKKYRDNFAFKHIEKKMLALGSPNTGSGSKLDIDKTLLAPLIRSTDPTFSSITDVEIDFPDAMQLARYKMQQQYGGDWDGSSVTVPDGSGGKTVHTLVSAKFTSSTITAVSKLTTEKFGYSVLSVIYDDQGNEVSSSTKQYSNNINQFRTLTVVAEYIGKGRRVFFQHLDVAKQLAYVKTVPLHLMPLVAIQEGGARTAPGSDGRKYQEWYMERFGLDVDEISKSLEERGKDKGKKIDNMYIMMGVQPRDIYVLDGTSSGSNCGMQKNDDIADWPTPVLRKATKIGDEYHDIPCTGTGSPLWWAKKNKLKRKKWARMLWDLMEYYGNTTLNVSFSQHLGIAITIKWSKKFIPGSFPLMYGGMSRQGSIELHRRTSTAGDIQDLVIKYHNYPDGYTEMTITDITEKIHVGNESFTLYLDGSWKSSADKDDKGGQGEKYPRLLVPQELWKKYDFTTATIVKEYGLEAVFFAKETVKLLTWKTLVGLVLTAVACYFGACAIGFKLMGWTAGATVTVSMAISYAVVMTAIQIGLQLMLEYIDNPYLRAALGFAINIGIGYLTTGSVALQLNTENYLKFATQLTTVFYAGYMESKMKELAEQQARIEAGETIETKIQNYSDFESSTMLKAYQGAHYSSRQTMDASSLYGQVANLYNYDQFYAASDELNLRVNVVPG